MSIVVSCKCGKRFKAKDHMAGRKVRCPGCKDPIRIPAGKVGAGLTGRYAKSGPPPPDVDAEAALLKYEAAQKQKQQDAESEAAYREEKNKLIESYDQLTGRATTKAKAKKKKKGEFAETGVKKPTVMHKAADSGATVLSNRLVKYLIIAGIVLGAAVGSRYLVKFITTYTSQQVVPKERKHKRIEELFKQTRTALNKGEIKTARDHLAEIDNLDPSKEYKPNTHTALHHQLDRAMEKEASEKE